MELIDGKKIADDIKKEIAIEVEKMVAEGKKRPHLAAVLVGHDGGSETYVAHKVKACEQCGFTSTLIRFEDDVTEEKLLETIEELNNNVDVDGFIVQLPLPKHISEQKIIEAEAAAKAKLIAAEAEATANDTIAKSLNDNILYQQWLEKWDGNLPQVAGSDANVIIDGLASSKTVENKTE